MTISELIEQLEILKAEHGELVVYVMDEEGRNEIGNVDLCDFGGKGVYDVLLR
jgi:hypothetical protein